MTDKNPFSNSSSFPGRTSYCIPMVVMPRSYPRHNRLSSAHAPRRPPHHLHIFALFLALSLTLLRPGGTLALLLPQNFLKTHAYADYRADALKQIDQLTVLDFGQFPGVAQEAIAFIARKSTGGTLK